jgi:hypothetical protein
MLHLMLNTNHESFQWHDAFFIVTTHVQLMTRITKQFNRRVHFRIATHVSIVKSHVYEKNIKILVRLMANTDRNTIEFYES